MRIKDYLKDRIYFILALLISIVLTDLTLYIFQMNKYAIILITITIILVNFFVMTLDIFRRKKFYDNTKKIIEKLDKKYLIHEILKSSSFLEGTILLEYLEEIDKSYNDDLCKYKYLLEEFKDYLELWCHEIKTPIATSKLVLLNEKNNSIDEELSQIEYYVEQVMYYARSENVEKDYIINKVSLKEIVNSSIKDNKKQLLSNHIKIKSIDKDIYVESDSKWLKYIINQILSNSIKYCKDKGEISFSCTVNKNNTILKIKDNGIGISSNDIDKVFDKGFTGKNGRINKYSTGIGLYLVKKLCDKLGHDIMIESKVDKETTVSIIFPNNSMISKNLTEM